MPDVLMYFRDTPMPDRLDNVPEDLYSSLRTGLQESRITTIRYAKYPGQETTREILPEVLFRYQGQWYIAAFCYSQAEPRTFRLDRITSIRPTGETGESEGIAEDYRTNGIPWLNDDNRPRPILQELKLENAQPLYPAEPDRKQRIINANIQLLSHAQYNKVDLMKEDLAAGADVDFRCGSGETPLTSAVIGGHWQAVRFLLDHGADIHRKNAQNANPLYLAVWHHRKELAHYFTEEKQCSPNEQDSLGWSSLTAAVLQNDMEMMQYLLDHGADIHVRDKDGRTLAALLLSLHHAGNLPMLRFLAEHGVDLHAVDQKGRNILFQAIPNAEPACTAYLLQAGIQVNTCDKKGVSPLHLAMQVYQHPQYTVTPENILRQQREIVRMLCDAGANVNAVTPEGTTPLMLAQDEFFDLLLEYGAFPGAVDAGGRTVAHHHVHDLRHMDLLAQAGVDLLAEDREGNNLLMAAPCHLQYIRTYVEEYGFSVHSRNHRQTLLHRAAIQEVRPEVVLYLLLHGAEPHELNQDGVISAPQEPRQHSINDSIDAFLNLFEHKDAASLLRACAALDLEALQSIPPARLDELLTCSPFGGDFYTESALSVACQAWLNARSPVPEDRIEAIFDLLVAHGEDPGFSPQPDGIDLIEVCFQQDTPRLARKYQGIREAGQAELQRREKSMAAKIKRIWQTFFRR